ncbi:MAG: adenosylcobinamide-phosphate synthase CbiB [Pseudomonadota bacterium]
MAELIVIISVAYILDLLLGDPPYPYHPIRIMGRGISRLEKVLMDLGWNGRGGGIILVFVSESLLVSSYLALNMLFYKIHPWLSLVFNLYLCYSCLAFGDLLNHIKPVTRSLEREDLAQTRRSISFLVGREVQGLDKAGLGRAAVETMAENFVDGFVSPLFWYFTGGFFAFLLGVSILPASISLMLIFKGASTLDSMVGYKNKRYLYFGWAGARLDDIMNLIPARISLLFLFLGAWIGGLEPMKGVRIALRDRLKHDSPNAAHAESFLAGVLGIRLGGPTRYPDGLKDKPWLGNGTIPVEFIHINQTAALLKYSAWTAMALFLSLLFLIQF